MTTVYWFEHTYFMCEVHRKVLGGVMCVSMFECILYSDTERQCAVLFQYHCTMVYLCQNKALQISATPPCCARQEITHPPLLPQINV